MHKRSIQLSELLIDLAPDADLPNRHLWLIELFVWIRGEDKSVDGAIGRVQLLLEAARLDPNLRARLRQWWQVLTSTVDSTTVLADFGFSARHAFTSEVTERLLRKLLPATPETRDAAELFGLALPTPLDVAWISAMDADTLQRVSDVLTQPSEQARLTNWQCELLQAITYCTSQIRAIGFTPELRLRMNDPARDAEVFVELAADAAHFCKTYVDGGGDLNSTEAAAQCLRERLELCRRAAATVYPHLDEHGISVNLVFVLRQLRERVLRVRDLMDCLMSSTPQVSSARLISKLVQVGLDRRSLRVLVQINASMLAAKLTDRSAETGESYITRDRGQYREMLKKAAYGGAITSLTTLSKFAIYALGVTVFWSGMLAGLMYAVSFIAIQLVHGTLATKQPAMTAPAMAAKLRNLTGVDAVTDFVDEVTHLVRSQVAAVLGNVGLVFPCVLVLSATIEWFRGRNQLDHEQALHVLHSVHFLQPSTWLFAAFTGVLLFVASLIAGWVENWFVLHRLQSAMRFNPRIRAVLGATRAARWAAFMRANISGLASNVSLGLMLGVLPPVLSFIGLGIDVRHVTLSAGQLAAAAAALGVSVLTYSDFWWCVAAIPVIGMLNLLVSFTLALRLAMSAHNVTVMERRHLGRAVMSRLFTKPLSFILPDKT